MNAAFLSLKRVRKFESAPDLFVEALEWIAGFPRLNKLMRDLDNGIEPALRALEAVCGRYTITGLENIPVSGSVVMVANHPLGGADIVAAMRILEHLNRPYRILANKSLSVPIAFKSNVISVDIYGDRHANTNPIRRIAKGWGNEFDTLFVFPARRCSRFNIRSRQIQDVAWHPGFVSLAERKGAAICPVHFSGRNSVMFYVLAMLLGDLAALRLPAEFFRFHARGLDCTIKEVFRRRTKSESVAAFANRIKQSIECPEILEP